MAAPTIPSLPTPPNMTSESGEFATRADAFLGALPEFGSKLNDLAVYTEQRALATDNAKGAAEAASTRAGSSATVSAEAASSAAQQRQGAEVAASAARAAAGLPVIQGKAFNKLRVNSAATGVEWALSSAPQEVFAANGVFKKEPDDLMYFVEVWGGGGGGAASLLNYAGGGGGGEHLSAWIIATGVTGDVPVTVGTGGTGGAAATDSLGSSGAPSSFGLLLSAKGGNGGRVGAQYATPAGSNLAYAPTGTPFVYLTHLSGYGSYGPVPGGDSSVGGGGGGGGYRNSGVGLGGTSVLSGKGGDGSRLLRVAGENGESPSGGGGGASYQGAGGKGGDGRVRITRLKS